VRYPLIIIPPLSMIKRIFPGLFHRLRALSPIRTASNGHAHRNAQLGHGFASLQSTVAKKSILLLLSLWVREPTMVSLYPGIQSPGQEDLVTRNRAIMTSAGSGQTRCLYSNPISGLTCFAMTDSDYLAMPSRLFPDCMSSNAQALAGSFARPIDSFM
jgi:hypothetical protein